MQLICLFNVQPVVLDEQVALLSVGMFYMC